MRFVTDVPQPSDNIKSLILSEQKYLTEVSLTIFSCVTQIMLYILIKLSDKCTIL